MALQVTLTGRARRLGISRLVAADDDGATSEHLWSELLGKYFVVAVYTGYNHSI